VLAELEAEHLVADASELAELVVRLIAQLVEVARTCS
jgi:hypothetical protein